MRRKLLRIIEGAPRLIFNGAAWQSGKWSIDYHVYNQNTLDHENHFMHIATLYKIDAKGAYLVTDYDRHFSNT